MLTFKKNYTFKTRTDGNSKQTLVLVNINHHLSVISGLTWAVLGVELNRVLARNLSRHESSLLLLK